MTPTLSCIVAAALSACGSADSATSTAADSSTAVADVAVDTNTFADAAPDPDTASGEDTTIGPDVEVAADVPVEFDGAASPDSNASDADGTLDTTPAPPTYRDALSVCWTDMTCPRAFVISHGGDWDADDPYDSKGAFVRAEVLGADGMKTDFLVTKDDVGIVAHSSPIEPWESTDCAGKLIEEMTADEVTACHLWPSETQTYQRVDDVLEWARGKMVVMLTVKAASAFPRAVSTIIEHHAEDYAFIETHFGDQVNVIPTVPNWDKVYYNVQIGSLADIDVLETTVTRPRILFCEMDPTYEGQTAEQMTDLIKTRLHGMGMRSFVSSIDHPTVEQHQTLFDLGFDVVMSYNLANGVQSRIATNTARGVTPP